MVGGTVDNFYPMETSLYQGHLWAKDEKRMQLIAHARKILEDDMKRRATPKPQTPKPKRW